MIRHVTKRVLRPSRTPILLAYRGYSDKFKSIDEFNKHKKDFKFGHGIDDLAPESPDEAETRRERLADKADGFQEFDLKNHPELVGLRPNSPEWKQQMARIQQEMQKEQEAEQRRQERRERLKGAGFGIAALVSVVSAYSLLMNYKYLKAWLNNKWTFDIDESNVQDMKDPKSNRKNSQHAIERLVTQLAKNEHFKEDLADSTQKTGIYQWGSLAKSSLPTRIPFFNDKVFKDVVVLSDYGVAIDDKGRAFHFTSALPHPYQVDLPEKVKGAYFSGDNIYYLSLGERDILYGPKLSPGLLKERKGWFGSVSVKYDTQKVKFSDLQKSEKIASIGAGMGHLLILTNQGRLFQTITETKSPALLNKGQFGLPKFSPYNTASELVANEAYALTNLNNEIVTVNDSKMIKPRVFSSIASGKFFNIAVEQNGNVWSWGDNAYGQCGKDVVSPEDIQPVPRLAFTMADVIRALKYSLPRNGAGFDYSIKDVFAASNSSYILMQCTNSLNETENQDLLLSYGTGLFGQLGTSRFVHLSPTPTVIKSLVGLTEFDEASNSTRNAGIKHVSAGDDHVLVTLANSGDSNDLMVFGENLNGQFGNGKQVKSSKPVVLPPLIEPSDLENEQPKTLKKLARKLNDLSRARLQLLKAQKVSGYTVDQVAVAGGDGSAIFYKANK